MSLKAKKNHDLVVTRWISEAARPLSIVDDPGLHELISGLTGGAYTLPCFDTVKNYIFELSAYERKLIKQEVKDLMQQGSSKCTHHWFTWGGFGFGVGVAVG